MAKTSAPHTAKIGNFQEGGTVASLYNTSGYGAIKHGDNTLKNVIKQVGALGKSEAAGTGNIDNMEIQSFEIVNGFIYGRGKEEVGIRGTIYQYDNASFPGKWGVADGNVSGVYVTGGFAHYQGYFYGYRPAGYIWRKPVTGSTWDDTWQTIGSFTYSAKPVQHFGGKTLYFFTDSDVHQLRDSTFTADVLNFQSGFVITCAAEYGNYLVICGYESATGHATAAFWDRDSSLARITNVVDLGLGTPRAVATLDGIPTVVMSTIAGELVVRQFDTNNFITKTKYSIAKNDYAYYSSESFVDDNILYFGLRAKLRDDDTDVANYIMAVDSLGRMSHRVMNTATAVTVTAVIPPMAVARLGNKYFMAYQSNFGVYETDTDSLLQAVIFETAIYKAVDFNHLNFVAVALKTTPLQSYGSVTVKARKNEAVSWTTIGTFSGSGDDAEKMVHTVTQHMALNSGADIGDAVTLQFRFEVIGADITGMYANFGDKDNEPIA